MVGLGFTVRDVQPYGCRLYGVKCDSDYDDSRFIESLFIFCCFVFSSNPLVLGFCTVCVCVCVCDYVSVSVLRYEYDNVSGVSLQSKMFPVQMKSLPN